MAKKKPWDTGRPGRDRLCRPGGASDRSRRHFEARGRGVRRRQVTGAYEIVLFVVRVIREARRRVGSRAGTTGRPAEGCEGSTTRGIRGFSTMAAIDGFRCRCAMRGGFERSCAWERFYGRCLTRWMVDRGVARRRGGRWVG